MKPILFNTEMVRAILDGRKTVTRRVAKSISNPDEWYPENDCRKSEYGAQVPCYIARKIATEEVGIYYPKYDIGDVLYVRETWSLDESLPYDNYVYRTNYGTTEDDSFPPSMFKWRPSIHMPKEAARIFLKVTDVRVERLQDMKTDDVIKEGAYPYDDYFKGTSRTQFAFEVWEKLWNSTIDKADLERHGWNANPWVWVIEFERCEKPESEE